MRAVDRQGNKGPPSNPAALWLPRPPSTDQVTIRARGPGKGLGHDVAAGRGTRGVMVVKMKVNVQPNSGNCTVNGNVRGSCSGDGYDGVSVHDD